MTSIDNSEIAKFKTILEKYNGAFFKTLKPFGSGLLEEIQKDKIDEVFTILNKNPTDLTHRTDDLSKFIRKIINFNIEDLSVIEGTAATNLRFVQKTTSGGTTTTSFNDFNKENIISTLKVLNVFVDILEAYKYCIDTENGIPPTSGSNKIYSGFKNDVFIDRIELVSNTTRIYQTDNTGTKNMYPQKQFKNIGYIRKIKETAIGVPITVLYLSIETFYTGMTTINYNDMFDKTIINGSLINLVSDNILNSSSLVNGETANELSLKNYARQLSNRDENISNIDLTLENRNKNLIKSLLKMLLNIDSYKKQTVYALYYYYKFVKLYSIFVINLSNVMYADQYSVNGVKKIETVNMAVPNMYYDMPTGDAGLMIGRGISGLEIDNSAGKTEGKGYRISGTKSNPIRFTETAPTGIIINNNTVGAAAIPSTSNGKIPLDTLVAITERGDMYISDPAAIFANDALTGDYTLDDVIISVAVPASGGTAEVPAVKTGINAVTLKTTIVPIPLFNSTAGQDATINYLRKTVNNIYDSITVSIFEMISSFDDIKNLDEIILSNNDAGTVPKVTLYNNKVALKITKPADIVKIVYANNKYNIKNDFIIFDNRNKNFYNIVSIRKNSDTLLYIDIDAVIDPNKLQEFKKTDKNFDYTVVFVNEKNELIQREPGGTELPLIDLTDQLVLATSDRINFLQFKKKELSIYKEEYTKEKSEIQLLDRQINKNSMDIEHQKNLYDTEYNKNLFLTRQIISYNTIIAFIILILVVINIIYVDKLFVKVVSLVCLAVVLLLFVVYFISSVTYIESFASLPAITDKTDGIYGHLLVASKSETTTSTEYINLKKIPCLQRLIKNMNFKFISYFEKIIITIPSTDSITFYKDIKMYIGKDKEIKSYSQKILEFNKNDTVNNIDLIKYEIENNKLYLMSLLIATIIFLSIYNMYLNYVSNDKFLSLTVFICVIILFIIGSYYIIRSNRRVRSFHKNIYWGPETYYRF
jgi:hypothetical protein